jgi:hypothetical protein
MTDKTYHEGGCSCGETRYRLTNQPPAISPERTVLVTLDLT